MRFAAVLFLWTINVVVSAGDTGSGRVPSDRDDAVRYPRLLAFRVGEGLKTEADYAPYALFDFVHGGGNKQWIRTFNAEAATVAHWRLGLAIKPGVDYLGNAPICRLGATLWPGHWLLYSGTKVTQDVAGDSRVTTIRVADMRVFQEPSESPQAFGPDDIQIYALDAAGKPVWEQSEQVSLVSIDRKASTITVKRGQYKSKPLAFRAGRAVAAAHARTLFFIGPDPKAWRVNMTLHCPRNPQGLTGAEYSGRLYGRLLLRIADSDGVEFDVGEWTPTAANLTSYRSFDGDNDLEPDGCYYRHPGIGVVNEHGLGQAIAVKTMRDVVGPGKIIQTDEELRGYAYMNGCEWESYPSNYLYDASAEFDRLCYVLSRRQVEPRISYLLGKRPTDRYTDRPKAHWGNNWPRMGLASALVAGAYYGYNSIGRARSIGEAPTGLGFGRFYLWDEYNGGKLNQKHYLGRPLGPAERLPGVTGGSSVLAPMEQAQVRAEKRYDGRAAFDSGEHVWRIEIRQQPLPASNGGVMVFLPVRLAGKPAAKSPFTLRGEVRAEAGYSRIDPVLEGVPSAIDCGLAETAERRSPHILADNQWRPFSVTLFSADNMEGLWLRLGEEPGTFEFRNLELVPGDGFVMTRRFEHGIALLNGSSAPVTFDLGKIDPQRSYRAIDGTITPDVNDGKPIERPLTVPAFDGRILLVR